MEAFEGLHFKYPVKRELTYALASQGVKFMLLNETGRGVRKIFLLGKGLAQGMEVHS